MRSTTHSAVQKAVVKEFWAQLRRKVNVLFSTGRRERENCMTNLAKMLR